MPPCPCRTRVLVFQKYASPVPQTSRRRLGVLQHCYDEVMQYQKILGFALAPSIVFFLLSLTSVALTVHYWILGDWIVPRGVQIQTQDFNERLQQYEIDSTIIYYIDLVTDATISSGCLNLTAAILALIAWSTLRKPGMDSQTAAGTRRFYILAIVVMTLAGIGSALASLVLHYTELGSQYGCKAERLMMGTRLNTNLYCTREQAACNFLPKYLRAGDDRDNAAIACNESVSQFLLHIVETY